LATPVTRCEVMGSAAFPVGAAHWVVPYMSTSSLAKS
jgi:hypothetical protein